MYLDSHCHITCDKLYEDVDKILENAKDLSDMLVMCTNKEEFERALPLKEKDSRLKVAFGFFPGDAKEITDEDLDYLEKNLKEGKVDLLGEIGLDYYWDDSFKEEQKELFIKQLKLAEKYRLPVSIHMRDASGDTLEILKKHAKTKTILHCYSGSPETMKELLKMDTLISFAGPVTFKNNKNGPACIEACPLDRILSETDSPYLTPVPYRGKTNQPAYVKYVADKIAEIKALPIEEVTSQIKKNYDTLFVK